MGYIAESLINGEFDMFTGEYIGESVGYPRTVKNNKRAKTNKSSSNKHKWKEVRQFLWDEGFSSKEILDLFKEFGTRVYGQGATWKSCNRTIGKFEEFKKFVKNKKL